MERRKNLRVVEAAVKSVTTGDHNVIRLQRERTRIPVDFLRLRLAQITGQRTALGVPLCLGARNLTLGCLFVQLSGISMIRGDPSQPTGVQKIDSAVPGGNPIE